LRDEIALLLDAFFFLPTPGRAWENIGSVPGFLKRQLWLFFFGGTTVQLVFFLVDHIYADMYPDFA